MSFHTAHLPTQWRAFIEQQAAQPYFQTLQNQVDEERQQGQVIYPPAKDVFNAFAYTDVADIKVVILGQDPYHGAGQAHGLAFSVKNDIKVPPSLVNMYKELATDISGFSIPQHGNLTSWAEQGVMLLNTVLTVKEAQPNSHAKYGWQTFTDNVIKHISAHNSGCVFVLWGANAHKKTKLIDENKHCILKGPHPSPLSAYRGFFGCQHFSLANQWLKTQNKDVINWQVS